MFVVHGPLIACRLVIEEPMIQEAFESDSSWQAFAMVFANFECWQCLGQGSNMCPGILIIFLWNFPEPSRTNCRISKVLSIDDMWSLWLTGRLAMFDKLLQVCSTVSRKSILIAPEARSPMIWSICFGVAPWLALNLYITYRVNGEFGGSFMLIQNCKPIETSKLRKSPFLS